MEKVVNNSTVTSSNNTQASLSRSNSRTSSNSELEKELIELEISDEGAGNAKAAAKEILPTKKRISSSRTPTRKAKRVRFYRNGDRFYQGIVIPVSNDRYRSFESLAEDLTRLLEDIVKVPGAVRNIFTLDGKKVVSLDDLEDGKSYVCSCNAENFKKMDYSSQPSIKNNNRLSSENKIHRLLLNKRNSPTYEHVLTAITQCVNLDTGCVRKVFTLGGSPVLTLADFFSHEDVFFAYGNERVGNDDFDLELEESKTIRQTRKTLRNGVAKGGPKPKMPVKSHNETYVCLEEDYANTKSESLPIEIQNRYTVGPIIGDGNFAVVLKIKEKNTGQEFALKIIDRSKCQGKEHYIDAEIRVMKKLNHPHIMALYMDIDTPKNTYLVLELVEGGDLFDAITQVTRFSEDQSRIMIKHLASAMAYLHSLGIVHRDIKPENLLVKLDGNGMVTELKLGDFGLACEVTEPLLAVCGTPTYVAPEILMETGYGLKIDVWAAGIILYILLCGFPPFVSPDNQQEPLFDAILSGIYDFPEPYWNDIGEGVRDLIANMLQSDPDLRFSSEDILDHYWVLGIDETNR
uniref:non-specific serine/threonine protein kinase n=2 Tax=Lutzomyia longipalpis TaxID=7200 RepID=A0A1B0GI90_LUTLO